MSGDNRLQPPKRPPPAAAARNASLAALSLVMLVGCATCGGIGFSVYLVVSHAEVRQLVGKVRQKLAEESGGLVPAPQENWEQWMIDSALSQAYTAALDAVAADPQLNERLGEGIGADFEAEQLYRRKRRGALRPEGETIEFDVAGSKGSAAVAVEVTGAGRERFVLESITVTLDDGTEISVPPPAEQAYRVR